jgi:START domain
MRDMRCNASNSSNSNTDSSTDAAVSGSSSNSTTDSTNNSSSNSELQGVEILPSGVLIEADMSHNETPSRVTTSRVTVVMHWDCKGALQRSALLSMSHTIHLRNCHVC